MSGDSPSLVMRAVLSDESQSFQRFHESNAGEYLWPKDLETIQKFIASGRVFGLFDSTMPVGACYLSVEEASDRIEFGGMFVNGDLRKRGIGVAMGKIAIAHFLFWNEPGAHQELIAHVHEFNTAPRTTLNSIGFSFDGKRKDTITTEPPPNMKRNAQGLVVGDVFVFDFARLDDVADFVEGDSGSTNGPNGSARIDIQLSSFTGSSRDELGKALRAMVVRRAGP